MTLVKWFMWNWDWIAQTIGKIGAATFSRSKTYTKWHLSSSFDETETESPKQLEKLVPQHLVAATLIQNDTCQVVHIKLKLNCPNVWKNWCHNIQLQKNTNLKWHLSSSFHETEIKLFKCLEKMVPQHSVAITLTRNHVCQVIFMKLKLNCPND